MTFRIPRPNVIESDLGYSVEVLGRVGLRYTEGNVGLRYTEGNQAFFVDSEVLAGPAGLVVYSQSIKAEHTPFDDALNDARERARIIENIRAAFRFRGLEIEIV